MKKIDLFLAALAILSLAASCAKEEKAAPKSTECKLSSLTVKVGDDSIKGFIDQSEKTIEISYMPNEYTFLDETTAVVEISEGATITPDPTQVMDYTAKDVKFTVTAEDGVTTSVYSIILTVAEFTEKAEQMWDKTYGDLGLDATTNQCCVAFSGTSNFVFSTLDVFDLRGKNVGTLNIDGIPGLETYNGQLGSMSNDENGVLVALCCYNGTDEGEGTKTSVYAWLDGWQEAPTLIYGPVDYQCFYMSVAGDVKGKFILNFRTGATGAPQMHHVLVYDGGGYVTDENVTWHGVMINHPGNDGCWGQQLSFFSADPEEGFVCWDSLAPEEYEETGNKSSAIYVYDGLSAYEDQYDNDSINETPLYGQVNWTNWDAEGRHFNYGNFAAGHVKAFVYNGQKYVLVSSSSWPWTWITIQKADNIVEDDLETDDVDESDANYFLGTDRIDGAGCFPCGAYVYDPATGTGHVIVASQSVMVTAYDMVTERM